MVWRPFPSARAGERRRIGWEEMTKSHLGWHRAMVQACCCTGGLGDVPGGWSRHLKLDGVSFGVLGRGYSFVELARDYLTKRVQGRALDLSPRSKILKAHTKASSRRFHYIHVEKWVLKQRESVSQPRKQGSSSRLGTQQINSYYSILRQQP